MKYSLWTDYGALNSKPVFKAFNDGAHALGHTCVYNEVHSDVDVIWSVLWAGKMARNQQIWERNQKTGKPTIVLEVGGICRGTTWKVGLNGINRAAHFGPTGNSADRARQLGLTLSPWRDNGDYILVCGQHTKSEQWKGMPPVHTWASSIIQEIRLYTDRPIVFRPHPRCPVPAFEHRYTNVVRETPVKLQHTYDDFDLSFSSAWATVSASSNPGIQSIIAGVPSFTTPDSIAYPVSIRSIANIENPCQPDRQQWLNDYAWTEYTLSEISSGLPLIRLTQ